MAIDYTPLYDGEIKWFELAKGVTRDELRDETHRLYDAVRDILEDCTDADITFEPYDPNAHDPHAATEEEKHIGWSLGHLVAHITASNEEGASFSSLLARGISLKARLRSEVPWEEIDTVEKALHRLEESRRMVLAYLDAWPDDPDLETLREFSSERVREFFGPINAPAAYLTGLSHHNEHLAQIEDVYRQAKAAQTA